MQTIAFIQDLAIMMLVAGFTTILFHRLKQPVVLGYILAGIIIGPHTPPVSFIHDQRTIEIFAQLGIMFLMFHLGLEFSFKKLTRVVIVALVAALLKISLMVFVGYELGKLLHWNFIESIFLGFILAISSTTIIIKSLQDLGQSKEKFIQLIYGILIIEDILAIALIALLSGFIASNSFDVNVVLITLGKLSLFLTVSLVIGILIIPRLMAYIARFKNEEMTLISTLGMFFGFSLLVVKLGYNVALGAFIIGAIMAESPNLKTIEKMIMPLRDMFSAVFFITVGLLFEPQVLSLYALPILAITIAVIVTKTIATTLGIFVTGYPGKTALNVGMAIAPIGEFSFIIAGLGASAKVTGDFLYPTIVTVSALTIITTPYLMRAANPCAYYIERLLPNSVVSLFHLYTTWLQTLRTNNASSEITRIVKRSLLNIFINFAVVAVIFWGISFFASTHYFSAFIAKRFRFSESILFGTALFVSLPFLIATYRKLKALSMLLAEVSVRHKMAGRFTRPVRKIISEIIPILSMGIIFIFICAFGASILPSTELLLIVLVIMAILSALLWRWFVKLHSRLQIALIEGVHSDDEIKKV